MPSSNRWKILYEKHTELNRLIADRLYQDTLTIDDFDAAIIAMSDPSDMPASPVISTSALPTNREVLVVLSPTGRVAVRGLLDDGYAVWVSEPWAFTELLFKEPILCGAREIKFLHFPKGTPDKPALAYQDRNGHWHVYWQKISFALPLIDKARTSPEQIHCVVHEDGQHEIWAVLKRDGTDNRRWFGRTSFGSSEWHIEEFETKYLEIMGGFGKHGTTPALFQYHTAGLLGRNHIGYVHFGRYSSLRVVNPHLFSWTSKKGLRFMASKKDWPHLMSSRDPARRMLCENVIAVVNNKGRYFFAQEKDGKAVIGTFEGAWNYKNNGVVGLPRAISKMIALEDGKLLVLDQTNNSIYCFSSHGYSTHPGNVGGTEWFKVFGNHVLTASDKSVAELNVRHLAIVDKRLPNYSLRLMDLILMTNGWVCGLKQHKHGSFSILRFA